MPHAHHAVIAARLPARQALSEPVRLSCAGFHTAAGSGRTPIGHPRPIDGGTCRRAPRESTIAAPSPRMHAVNCGSDHWHIDCYSIPSRWASGLLPTPGHVPFLSPARTLVTRRASPPSIFYALRTRHEKSPDYGMASLGRFTMTWPPSSRAPAGSARPSPSSEPGDALASTLLRTRSRSCPPLSRGRCTPREG